MIPQAFLDRMQALLGGEYPAFLRALTEERAVRGLRVNLRKTTPQGLCRSLPFALEPLPYDDAFLCREERVGQLAQHHAGMFYMQDPSAMATLHALPIEPGWRVLDVCAAPGGKSSQIADAIAPTGLLVCNEYQSARCHVLVSNLERLGYDNTVVTNLDSAALAALYPGGFDLVLCDAPCSGEGMLRKYEVASEEWSPEQVLRCAQRQKEILRNAAQTVRPGGRLLYSTCTFSVEENEEVVADFLERYPDFSLLPVADVVAGVTSPGIPQAGCRADLRLTRRFYPHVSPGEGQYIALFARAGEAPIAPPRNADTWGGPSAAEARVVRDFLEENFDSLPHLCLRKNGELIYGLREDFPLPRGTRAAGVCLGRVQKNRFEPEHHLFMAYGHAARRKLSLSGGDERALSYLQGQVIPCPDVANGWGAVLVDGAALGGVKCVDGVAKNHYPKGLRLRKI